MNELSKQLIPFEQKIGIDFTDKDILLRAFTHRSFINEKKGRGLLHNERIEFLGDAVLEIIVTDFLFHSFPKEDEGTLTAYRAAMVNTDSLSMQAKKLELDSFLLLSKGERMDTNKGRDHILANTFEALIGAIYLDQGLEKAAEFVGGQLFDYMQVIIDNQLHKDPKSYFQELAQDRRKTTPYYELVESVGPDHDKEFVMGAYLEEEMIATGSGQSKQKAESEAARAALEALEWLE